MKHFTLHVRLTKACNADCSYCSSWQSSPDARMKPDEYSKSLDFIIEKMFPLMGYTNPNAHMTVQYVGGEILTLPKEHIKKSVITARQKLTPYFSTIIDGVQSNLIGSTDRISLLYSLFGHRISTSTDLKGNQRLVGGSKEKYRELAQKGRNYLKTRRFINPGQIFVVDKQGIHNAEYEVDQASLEEYPLTLRAVFAGGKEIDEPSPQDIADLYAKLFDKWFLKMPMSIEPFTHLLLTRYASKTKNKNLLNSIVGCPFQRNCAKVSLNLEPNGDLYICLDMADSGHGKLGNALTGELNLDEWKRLNARTDHIDEHCQKCTWKNECQGGCMNEAMIHHGDPYARTELCIVWKTLFAKIDEGLKNNDDKTIQKWIDSIT